MRIENMLDVPLDASHLESTIHKLGSSKNIMLLSKLDNELVHTIPYMQVVGTRNGVSALLNEKSVEILHEDSSFLSYIFMCGLTPYIHAPTHLPTQHPLSYFLTSIRDYSASKWFSDQFPHVNESSAQKYLNQRKHAVNVIEQQLFEGNIVSSERLFSMQFLAAAASRSQSDSTYHSALSLGLHMFADAACTFFDDLSSIQEYSAFAGSVAEEYAMVLTDFIDPVASLQNEIVMYGRSSKTIRELNSRMGSIKSGLETPGAKRFEEAAKESLRMIFTDAQPQQKMKTYEETYSLSDIGKVVLNFN